MDLDRFVGELKSLDRPALESLFEGTPREFGREHVVSIKRRLLNGYFQPLSAHTSLLMH